MAKEITRRWRGFDKPSHGGPGSGLLVSVRLAVFLAVLASASSQSWAGEEKQFEVRIANRAVAEGGPALRASQGDQVVITWYSDEAGELHLHGYDITIELSPEAPVQTSFEAFAAGRFPFTSHGFGQAPSGHEALLYLEVYPD